MLVSKRDEDGAERRLAVLTDGDHFGEMALLADEPRFASVRTLSDSVSLVLDRDRFDALLNRTPQLREALMRKCAERARASQSVMRTVSQE